MENQLRYVLSPRCILYKVQLPYTCQFLDVTLVLQTGVATTPPPNAQPRGKIAPGTLKFMFSPQVFGEKIEPTTSPWGRASFQSWEMGGWCYPVISKFCYSENFEVICTPDFVFKLGSSFSTIFSKKSHEIACFLWFFYVKIYFYPYLTHRMTISQFSRACSHCDVIVTLIAVN